MTLWRDDGTSRLGLVVGRDSTCARGEKPRYLDRGIAWLKIKRKRNEAPTYISAWSLRALDSSSDDCNHAGDARDFVAKDARRAVRL